MTFNSWLDSFLCRYRTVLLSLPTEIYENIKSISTNGNANGSKKYFTVKRKWTVHLVDAPVKREKHDKT